MSLLLWIFVVECRLSHWQLGGGFDIVGLRRLMFDSSFGHIGTTKTTMDIDYESIL